VVQALVQVMMLIYLVKTITIKNNKEIIFQVHKKNDTEVKIAKGIYMSMLQNKIHNKVTSILNVKVNLSLCLSTMP